MIFNAVEKLHIFGKINEKVDQWVKSKRKGGWLSGHTKQSNSNKKNKKELILESIQRKDSYTEAFNERKAEHPNLEKTKQQTGEKKLILEFKLTQIN